MKIENCSRKLFDDICKLVEKARAYVAVTANWKIGDRINNDLLDGKWADYGKQIVSDLAAQLQQLFLLPNCLTKNCTPSSK